MNTNSEQQIRISADDVVDIHAIDGLLWGLPVRLGLAAKQRGRTPLGARPVGQELEPFS